MEVFIVLCFLECGVPHGGMLPNDKSTWCELYTKMMSIADEVSSRYVVLEQALAPWSMLPHFLH